MGSPVVAPTVEAKLNQLATSGRSVTVSDAKLLLDVGLEPAEVDSFVYKSDPHSSSLTVEQQTRVKLLASVVAKSLDVFGSHRKTVYWLRQPMQSLGSKSPLEFLQVEADSQEIEDCLSRIAEGSFA